MILAISIFVRHTNAFFAGDEFFFCSKSIPLKLWNLGVILCLRVDLRNDLDGVFSLESVPESVSKFRSLRELLQLSVSAIKLARLLRARLDVDEVVCTLVQECVDDGVPGWFCKWGVAGVDAEPGHEYLV